MFFKSQSSIKLFKSRIYQIIKYFLENKKMPNENLLKPPPDVRGMTKLNKSIFQKDIEVPCLYLQQVNINQVMKVLKKYLLKMEKFKPVQNVDDVTEVYLNPMTTNKWTEMDEKDREILVKLGISQECFGKKHLTIDFDNYSIEDTLKAILPTDQEGMSSYTRMGHLVHVNLREHLLPYKNVIGEVLYDKVPNCKTVVNKTDNIDNTYRNFKMEILCGEDDMKTKVKENLCLYEFDFSKVYWNSRLSTEHERIVKLLNSGDVVFDVFAGVGPFAIPAAKKKCLVFANDLNPESYKWLNHNMKLNKIDEKYLKTFCKDGRDFIQQDLKENMLRHVKTENIHIIMNLPAMAVEFLSAFRGLYSESELTGVKNILIYVYCFAKGEDPLAITNDLIKSQFDIDITSKIETVFKVRTVSNFKEMMRVVLKLDEDILVRGSSKRKLEDLTNGNKRSVYCIYLNQLVSNFQFLF